MSARAVLDRFARSPYGPVAALVVVAAASLGVIQWNHVTWRNSLSQTVAALDNIERARVRLTQAYLAATRADAGDPTFGLDQAVAHLQDATRSLDDWLAGRSGLIDFPAAAPDDAELRALAREFRSLVTEFQGTLTAREDSAAVVDRRVAFAGLERSAAAIESRIHDNLRTLIARQERKVQLLLAGWIGFLAVVGFTVHVVSQSRHRAEQRYRLLSTLAPVGIFLTDRTGSCIEVNDGFRTLTGQADSRACPWFDVIHAEERGAARAAWQRLVAEGAPFADEYRVVRPDGTLVWVLAQARAEGDARFVGTLTDVTQRKAIEAQLRHAQKMEAVGQMTGGIAHDFRNILTIIMGTAETIANVLPRDAPDLREDLAQLQGAARRGADITKKLLRFSRMDHLAVRPVDLCEVIRENGPMLRQLVPVEVRVVTDIPQEPLTAEADVDAVMHILANLTANARDAMPKGGTVQITARWHPDHVTRDRVAVSVIDDGSGMDEATKQRIFDPFFTTKPPGAGTGLGMPMVAGLMKDQGGTLEVESAPGEGTQVHLYFRGTQMAPRESAPVARPSIRGGAETILLVEDEEALRRVAHRALEKLGYRVLVATDGEEALEVLRDKREEIHLVVSDSVMPRLSGPDLYAAIQREGFGVRFLFASGYAPNEAPQPGALSADVPYLPKPWLLEELARKVREVLDHGR